MQETWLNETVDDNEIIGATSFNISRKDRSAFNSKKEKGGGVAILIRNSIQFQELNNKDCTSGEIQAVRVTVANKSIVIFNVYVPPYSSQSRVIMFKELEIFLNHTRIKYKHDDFIVAGDFNLPRINWTFNDTDIGALVPASSNFAFNRYETKALECFTNSSLAQINHLPNSRSVFLDLVFASNINNIVVSTPTEIELLDKNSTHHSAIELQIKYTQDCYQDTDSEYNFFNLNFRKAREEMGRTKFNWITDDDVARALSFDAFDFTSKIDSITSHIFEIQRRHTRATKKNEVVGISSHPWLKNKKYEKLYKAKLHAKSIYLQFPTDNNRELLKLASISVVKQFHKLKDAYYRKLIDNIGGHSREFFDMMRTKKKKKSVLPLQMSLDGRLFHGSDRLIALTNHLQSCFSCPIDAFSSDLNELSDEIFEIYGANYKTDHQEKWHNYNNFFTLEEICDVIRTLDIRKDSGPMDLSVRFIKFNMRSIAPVLLNLFDAIMMSGIVPESWKISYLTPIPKKGKITEVGNYRGIAMQSVIPKIFDKLFTEKLYNYVHELIPRSQHGFIRKRSTMSNLYELTQFLHENIHRGNQVDVVYFDFSKAFDRVDHRILAKKLAALSIPYMPFKTIISFITNRKYILKVDGQAYQQHQFSTKSSVPQGSHCGPLLFLIMCHDINICIKNTMVNALQLADDTKFFHIVNTVADRDVLQNTIDNLVQWTINNKIDLNSSKTYFMSFANRRRNFYESHYYIGTTRIEQRQIMRDLGVIFDDALTFKHHIQDVSLRARKLYGAAYRFAREINLPMVVIKIIKCYIFPIMEYCSPVWSQNRIGAEAELEKVLHIATRFALHSAYLPIHPGYLTFDERLERLGLCRMAVRRRLSTVITTLKFLKNEIDSDICARIQNLHRDTRSTRNPPVFDIPRTLPLKSPLYLGILAVNQTRHIYDINSSIAAIKSQLKEHMYT